MSAEIIKEALSDPIARGQYLAAIRNRGKDVLLGDIEMLINLLLEAAVEIDTAKNKGIDSLVDAFKTNDDIDTEAWNSLWATAQRLKGNES